MGIEVGVFRIPCDSTFSKCAENVAHFRSSASFRSQIQPEGGFLHPLGRGARPITPVPLLQAVTHRAAFLDAAYLR